MNDAYSKFPPPPECEIKKTLMNELKIKNSFCREVDIKQCIDEVFEEFGGMKNVGSYTMWNVVVHKELLKKTTERLNLKKDKTLNPTLNTQAL